MTTSIKAKPKTVEQTNINTSRVLKLKAEYKRTSLNKIVFLQNFVNTGYCLMRTNLHFRT